MWLSCNQIAFHKTETFLKPLFKVEVNAVLQNKVKENSKKFEFNIRNISYQIVILTHLT